MPKSHHAILIYDHCPLNEIKHSNKKRHLSELKLCIVQNQRLKSLKGKTILLEGEVWNLEVQANS